MTNIYDTTFISVKEKFGITRRGSAGLTAMGKPSPLSQYWRESVAQYLKELRKEVEKSQKQLPGSRSRVSEIENASANFTLDTLLDLLEDLGGNISDAFRSRVPKQFHGTTQLIHEQLQAILEDGDPSEQQIVTGAIEWWYSSIQLRHRQKPR